MVDSKGRPIRILLSSGTAHDSLFAKDLVEGQHGRTILADKAYDTDAFRLFLEEQGLKACIPPKSNRKQPSKYHKGFYKHRRRVENYFQKTKELRAIATRYEKLDCRFLSLCYIAAIYSWI